MSNLAGVGIALLTILVICIMGHLIGAMFTLADAIQEMIFYSDAHILWKIIFLIPWLALRVFTIVFLIIGILCGISLAEDIWKWLKK